MNSVAVGVTLWLVLLRASQSASIVMPTARTIATQLTSYGGRQTSATISPDGRSFAFVSDHAGTPDIWLRQISGGEPIRLTNDAVEESELAFAVDGESIYFSRLEKGTSAIWQIGTLGGQARTVITGAHSAAPSPDGRTLAYMVPEQPGTEALMISALDGSEKQSLVRQIPWFPPVRPAWAPDGHRIAYIRAGLFAPANLFVVDMRDGREHQVTRFARAGQALGTPVWLRDNRHLVASYSAYSRTQSQTDLAIVDLEDGSISRVTTTIDDSFTAPSLSANGSRLMRDEPCRFPKRRKE
jgi:Tol biopolymer transport system component